MGRFLVLRIEDNKVSKKLAKKLQDTESIQVVGEFVIPSKWCEGECDYGDSEVTSIRSRKWGTWHCPICRRPKKTTWHNLRNQLEDEDLPVIYRDLMFTVRSWFTNEPEKVYGKDTIERAKQRIAENGQKIERRYRRTRGA